jgi:hypothetical protein
MLEVRNRLVVIEGPAESGWIPAGAAPPIPYRKELILNFRIEADSGDTGGWFLISDTVTGEHFADTWHRTEADAIEQAVLSFGIEPGEWNGRGSLPN